MVSASGSNFPSQLCPWVLPAPQSEPSSASHSMFPSQGCICPAFGQPHAYVLQSIPFLTLFTPSLLTKASTARSTVYSFHRQVLLCTAAHSNPEQAGLPPAGRHSRLSFVSEASFSRLPETATQAGLVVSYTNNNRLGELSGVK